MMLLLISGVASISSVRNIPLSAFDLRPAPPFHFDVYDIVQQGVQIGALIGREKSLVLRVLALLV